MPAFRHVIAIVLAVLWLPTTQHCGLEAAGMMVAEASHETEDPCCQPSGGSCAQDACEVVEGVFFKSGSSTLKAPSPLWAVCTPFLVHAIAPPTLKAEPDFEIAEAGDPVRWIPVWAFVRRAAPLSRAPSQVG